jgi:phage terminase small subunit
MGRGRAKAKQQKVARELKYNSHFTDLDALQRELGGSPSSHSDSMDSDEEFDDEEDDWSSTRR